MKKIFSITFFIFLLFQFAKSQNNKMISIQLSYNKIELGFEHKILNEKLFAELYAGIANQDINSSFDDIISRIGIGYAAFSNTKNQISFYIGMGIYFTNNNYYSIVVPLVNAGTRYTRFFGKTRKHGLFINAGYCYGQRDYKQQYSSDIFDVSTIGTFKLTPVYFSIGYGFKL